MPAIFIFTTKKCDLTCVCQKFVVILQQIIKLYSNMSKDLLKEVRDGVEAMIAENKKYWDENKTVPSHAEYKRESIQIPKSEARVEPHDAQQQKRNRMSYKHAVEAQNRRRHRC